MTYIHTNYNDPSFVPVSPWVRVTHSGEFGQDLELLSARQALTLQGAQQVVAILRGKKLQLGNRLENLMEHLWKSHGTHGIFMEHLWKSDGTRGTSMEHRWNIYGTSMENPKTHDLSSYSPCLMAISLNCISPFSEKPVWLISRC